MIQLISLNERHRVGRPDASQAQDIVLSGTGILNEHCVLENKANETVVLRPCSAQAACYVNGKRVDMVEEGDGSVRLKSGDRVIFGKNHVFRYINPEQVRREKAALTVSGAGSSTTLAQSSAAVTGLATAANNNGWSYKYEHGKI